MIKNFYIDDLKISDPSLPLSNGYALSVPIQGLETPPLRISSYPRVGEHGLSVSNIFYDGRVVTIPGIIHAKNPDDYLSRRQALTYACRIQKNANQYPVEQTFSFTTSDDEEYTFSGIPKVIFDVNAGRYVRFLLTIICSSPYIFKAGVKSSGSITRPIAGGVLIPATIPATLGASSGGSGYLTNDGNAESHPIITITGQVTNPYIENTLTGEFVQLSIETEVTDTIIIDMLKKTIVLNGTSILNSRVSGSSWFTLQPGLNEISYSTSETGDTGTVEISWYDAMLGI